MNRDRVMSSAIPLLIGIVLSMSACAYGRRAGHPLDYGGGSGGRRDFVRHASWHGGRDDGFAGHGDFGGRGSGGDDRRSVLLAPPPFTATYPSLLGQAHGSVYRYYEAHASEGGGQCLAPYIAGITNTKVVENHGERLTIDVRYLYRDRIKDQTRGNPADALTLCFGFGGRRFVLASNGDSLDVEEMSGPRRN